MRSSRLVIAATAVVALVVVGSACTSLVFFLECSSRKPSSLSSSFLQNTTCITASDISYNTNDKVIATTSPSPSSSSTTTTTTTTTTIPVSSSSSAGSTHAQHTPTSTSTSTSTTTTLSASMGFQGRNIPECCCSFCEIERVNAATVYPLLKKIVETPFFSHFKIDLCSSCQLWEDAPLCRMKDCGVCECDEPPAWSFENVPELPPTGPDCSDDNVVTTVDSKVLEGWMTKRTSTNANDNNYNNNNNPFGLPFLTDREVGDATLVEDEYGSSSSSSAAQVVDLLKNPEGYTGYTGPSAEKVWSAVHSQNCFQQPPDTQKQRQSQKLQSITRTATEGENENADEIHLDVNSTNDENDNDLYCFLSSEQRLYNRFISGLHSSISLHIAHSYCLEMDPHQVGECRMWGLNDRVAHDRVLSHPDRVENLYVAFSLLLRAVVKAEEAIAAAVPEEDPILQESLVHWKEDLLPELLALAQKTPATFDESSLLFDGNGDDRNGNANAKSNGKSNDRDLNLSSSSSSKAKRSELQRRFGHLQSIMQCVGCDRCKLWGTLQTLGVGTALKILFHDNKGKNDNDTSSIYLSRQEAVALVNTLERLSSSLVFAHEFRMRRETMELFDRDDYSSCKSSTGWL